MRAIMPFWVTRRFFPISQEPVAKPHFRVDLFSGGRLEKGFAGVINFLLFFSLAVSVTINQLIGARMKKMFLSVVVISSLVAGCATPTVVAVRKAGDAELSCSQLKAEYEDAKEFEAKARKERGVTGTNVVAAVLFWPAMVGTYANTEEAINASKDRQKRLEKLAEEKKCKI